MLDTSWTSVPCSDSETLKRVFLQHKLLNVISAARLARPSCLLLLCFRFAAPSHIYTVCFQSAVGHDYQSKLSKHCSQVDTSKGFGGKFGVQADRVDQVLNLMSAFLFLRVLILLF